MLPLPSPPLFLRWVRQPLWLGVGLSVLVMVWALLAWGYTSGLAAVHRSAHVQVLNTAVLLGNGLAHLLDDVDTQLQRVQAQAKHRLTGGSSQAQAERDLQALLEHIDERHSVPVTMGVMDLQARARWLPDHKGLGATVLAPDTLQAALGQPDQMISLGPTLSVFTQRWVVRFVRVVRDDQGQPLAVAFADIGTAVLGRGFDEVDLGNDGVVNLRTTDLAQVYRHPAATGTNTAVGNRNVSKTARDLLAVPGHAEQGFTYTTVAPIDNTERVYAYYKVPRHPFYMTVGRATADLSGPFRATSALVGLATALASVGLLAMGWRLQRLTLGLVSANTTLTQDAQRSGEALAELMQLNRSRNELLGQVLRGESLGQLLVGAMASLEVNQRLGPNVGVGLWQWHPRTRRWECRLSNMSVLLQEALAESDMMVLSGQESVLHPADPLWPTMALNMASPKPTWQSACSWPGTHDTERFTWVVFSDEPALNIVDLRHHLNELFSVFQVAVETHLQRHALMEQREDMLALYDHSPAGFLTVDTDGTVIRANRTLLTWLSFVPTEVVGRKRLQDLLVREDGTAHELRDKWGNLTPVKGELGWRRRDSTVLYAVTASSVIRNDQGEPVGMHIALNDVTQLRRQRHVFSNVLMNAPMAVHVAHPVTQSVMFMNEAFNRLSLKVQGDTDSPRLERWFVDEAALAAVRRSMQLGVSVLNQLMAVRSPHAPLGDTLWVMCSFMPLEFNGRPAVLTWMYDVTALHLAQTQADQANAAKTRFMADLSHELRTPLNAIGGMAHALTLANLPAEQGRMVDVLSNASLELMALINDVLDLSKAEAGELVIHPTPFALGPWLQGVLTLFEQQAEAKHLELVSEMTQEVPPWVSGDAGKLRQMLTNLVSNALKFTDRGTVAVRLSGAIRSSGVVDLRVEVSDSGVGVPKADQPHLFEPYRQAHHNEGARKGTGLGLSIVRRYAEAMGGSVGLTSQEGRGTTVWFNVPLQVVWEAPDPVDVPITRTVNRVSQSQSANAPTSSPLADARRLQGLRVMAVDDSPSNLDVVEVLLQPQGVILTRCASGAEALSALKAQPQGFDVVLMDLHMPTMDGYATTLSLRHVAPTLPVLALTAASDDGLDLRVREAGMVDLLRKPVEPAKLIRALTPFVKTNSQPPGAEAWDRIEWSLPVPDGWPEVPGIDGVEVSQRLLGNVALFRELLERNAAEINGFLTTWGAEDPSLEQGGAQAALHRIKGQSGNLGAKSLFNHVRDVEQLLVQRQPVSPPQWHDMLTAMRRWVAQVQALPWLRPNADHGSTDALSPQEAIEALSPLADAVMARQFGAVGQAKSIDALMRLSAWAPAWETAMDALNRYDYALAEERLNALLEHLRASLPVDASGIP